ERVAQRDEVDEAGLLVQERKRDASREVAGLSFEAVVPVQRVLRVGEGPRLARGLARAQGAVRERRQIIVAKVEDVGAPLKALLEIEVQNVEVRVARDRVEAEEDPVVAQEVREDDRAVREDRAVVRDAERDRGSVDAPLALVLLLFGIVE